jgi:glycosyltransferase involved in cell wall biosynthesis
MHIVHVTHRAWPVAGGSEQYVHEIARRQVAAGHQVTVVATQAQELSALWTATAARVPAATPDAQDGIRIVRLPLRYLPLGNLTFAVLRRITYLFSHIAIPLAAPLVQFFPWVPALPETLGVLQADLYFAWNLTLEGLTAAVAHQSSRQHIPWIAVPLLHLARPAFYTMPHQLHLLRDAACILTQTSKEREFLLARDFEPRRVVVVSPGVAAAPPPGEAHRPVLYKSNESPLVITIGALGYAKGTLHLLGAARRLWKRGIPLELALIGTVEPAVERAIARLPELWRERCHCLGRISEAEKWALLAAADVLALPSRTESFGIVFLEAWLCRKPVIGARAGAVPDVVQHGVDGLLVEFGDVAGLADALRVLVTDPARAAQLGEHGYQKVQQRYTWDYQYARLQEIMAQVHMEWRE